MKNRKLIHVHRLGVSDFEFVRRLAAKQTNFTIPPRFVLWLLIQTNSESCLVVEHSRFGAVGYLLSAVIRGGRSNSLYVWQLAAAARGETIGATEELLLTLKAFIKKAHIRRLLFTAIPNSPQFRAVRRYAYTLFGSPVLPCQKLPGSISRHEHEFVIKVR